MIYFVVLFVFVGGYYSSPFIDKQIEKKGY